MELATQQPSFNKNQHFAYQRLQAVLSHWERDKQINDYNSLYICARQNGQRLKSVWVDSQAEPFSAIKSAFDHLLDQVTSFEAEFLYEPQSRYISLTDKKQWNSLRGKRAAIIEHQSHTSRWSSLEMIARNLSFQRIASNHLIQVARKGTDDTNTSKQLPVTLYKTKQYYCSNSASQDPLPSPLYRGNEVVKQEEVNKQNLLLTIKAMTHWLASQVNEQGEATYKYWPSRGQTASSNNAIRQWMATVCLNRAALAFKGSMLQTVAATNLAYNIKTTFTAEKNLGYILMDGSAKLGSAALAALAILESPHRQQYVSQEYKLNNLIAHLSNQNGSFDTFYIPRERKDNQNFYSGEALLFLASRYVISRNADDLKRFMAGFHYYRDWHLANRNPAFVPWHTQAYYIVWQVTQDKALKDFIFEMNDWLLSMQQWDSAEFSDMQGRFYDPKRAYYGPPHASSTGVYLEGLIDAFSLAKQCNEQQRAERYRIAIVRGIRSIMQLQYKNEIDCFYIKNTAKVLGGIRTTVYDNTIRIDNVQHALMALLKVINRFTSEDYSFSKLDKSFGKNDTYLSQKLKPENISDNSVFTKTNDLLFFRLKDFKVDIHEMRRDFEANIRHVPATPYHHAGMPYEGWAITSRDGSASDGVKRISAKQRVLNGVKVEDATVPTELCSAFISDILKQLQALGLKCFRVRYMKMGSEGFDMNFHRDAKRESWRLHIPLYTNRHCFFEWETKERGKVKKHLIADGSAYLVRVDELHRGANYAPEMADRIHFILSLEEAPAADLIDKTLVEYILDKRVSKPQSSNFLWKSSDLEGLLFSLLPHDDWYATQTIMTARKQTNGIYFAKGEPEQSLKYIVDNDSRAVICESGNYEFLKSKTTKPIYLADNMFETARAFADLARARFEGKVVGITGSVGKTTIKDGLTSLLSAISNVHASKGNQNADWGLLETISNTPPNVDYAVYELGMLGKKSIGLKSRRVAPHIAVITNVFDAHRSFHSSDESIAETKAEILEGVVDGGIAILPADSPWFKVLYEKANTYPNVNLLTFGESNSADIRLISYNCSSGSTELVISILGEENTFVTSLLGRQAAMNCTILISVVYALGINLSMTKGLFKMLRPSKRRGDVFSAPCSNGVFSIIDDTWNASPASVIAAMNNMQYVKRKEGGNKVLFIGDMLQLGENERQKHIDLADAIIANGIDKVFTIGELSQSLFQALPLALRGQHFSDATTASKIAKECVGDGDVVLVKGSNAMEMWRIVRALQKTSVAKVMVEEFYDFVKGTINTTSFDRNLSDIS